MYFTSDLHFFHKNIINLSKRPYQSLEEMHEQLIHNWNSVVPVNGLTYILGDFSLTDKAKDIDLILFRLNGQKHLIKGNHDRSRVLKKTTGFQEIALYKEISHADKKIVLCHFPILSWNLMHRGSIHLHGHCHGNIPSTRQRYDVGVDCNEYTPIHIEAIFEKLKELPKHNPEFNDHHQTEEM